MNSDQSAAARKFRALLWEARDVIALNGFDPTGLGARITSSVLEAERVGLVKPSGGVDAPASDFPNGC